MQACSLTYIHREAGTCYLHTEVKVYQVILLCQLPVWQWVCNAQRWVHVPVTNGIVWRTLTQVALHHMVILSAEALRHLVVWYIWYLAKQRHQVLFGLCLCCLQSFALLFQLSYGFLCCLSCGLVALLHQFPNLCSSLLLF